LDSDDLKENPIVYLHSIFENDLPRRMQLFNSMRTVDLVGVTQEILENLFRAIIKKELFPRTGEGLPPVPNKEYATCLWEIARLFHSFYFDFYFLELYVCLFPYFSNLS